MIYFEEVMSGLCSEDDRVYGGATLVQIGHTCHMSERNAWLHPFFKRWKTGVGKMSLV